MPEVLPGHVPAPIAIVGWDGTRYNVIGIDAAFHVQVDVITTALAGTAPTLANQLLILGQLQSIEDIRDALQSVANDRLIVRGEDQLFSIDEVVINRRTAIVSGAGGYVDSHPVPAGRLWHITRIVSRDRTNATTAHIVWADHDGTRFSLGEEIAAFAAMQNSYYDCDIWLDPDDFIRVDFTGSLVGDNCDVGLFGHQMTLEA